MGRYSTKLIEKRIAEAKADGWKRLDLNEWNVRDQDLRLLLTEVGIDQLRALELRSNRLTELPPEIGRLTALMVLNLDGNRLPALPPEIGRLTALTHLNLDSNHLTSLPSQIGQLTALTNLDLGGNQLISLPAAIGQLTALTRINLNDNQLSVLPQELGRLFALTELYLSRNRFTLIPAQIWRLSRLVTLVAHDGQLAALPPEIGQLSALTELRLSNNRIASLPPEVRDLAALKTLDLSWNPLTCLPNEICSLTKLESLDLRENNLATLPRDIGRLTSLTCLYLHGNEALGIPPEILGPTWEEVLTTRAKPASPQAILDYYFRISTQTTQPLNEAKMILVGRGEVGKTSLVRRLLGEGFNRKEGKTPGIKIDKWSVTLHRQERVLLHIWDFGGQEIMHATHRFFLTKRSLYLVVLNGREGGEDADAEYWLKTIATLDPDSPVLIVLNKFRQQPFDLNRRALQAKYPNICGFVETDCANPKPLNIGKLRAAIKATVDEHLPEMRAKFPASWAAIKNDMATMKENFVTFDRYREICARHKETDSLAQERLATHLNDLGIALNYKDDPRLCDKHVLNPHWVTNGIYRILNAPKLAAARGTMSVPSLASMLDAKVYPKHMHAFLLELMRKFELCFAFPDDADRYLIPELLGKDEAEEVEQFKDAQAVHFQYKYGILPEGLIPRFIVRTYVHSEGQPRWRTGVILKFEGNRALVRADIHEGCVEIAVNGPVESRRRLLTVVRSQFDHIHDTLKLKPQALVPVPAIPGLVMRYEDLVAYENAGVHEPPVPFGGVVHKVDVRALLEGIDLEGARSTMRTSDGKPLRLFYSYSSKDEEFKLQFETHLTLLKRQGKLDTWNMRMIPPGKEWEKVIDENIKAAEIILLLVSADFIASDYCYDIEMKFAMQQHEQKKATVIPVIVRKCDRSGAPFAKLQALPKDAMPINLWPDRDSAWADVVEALRKHLEALRPSNR